MKLKWIAMLAVSSLVASAVALKAEEAGKKEHKPKAEKAEKADKAEAVEKDVTLEGVVVKKEAKAAKGEAKAEAKVAYDLDVKGEKIHLKLGKACTVDLATLVGATVTVKGKAKEVGGKIKAIHASSVEKAAAAGAAAPADAAKAIDKVL